MLADQDYQAFRDLVEGQSLRGLRRYLDYGKRAHHEEGLTELYQWLGRMLDREAVYDLPDKASVFEIGTCEWLAKQPCCVFDADQLRLAGCRRYRLPCLLL